MPEKQKPPVETEGSYKQAIDDVLDYLECIEPSVSFDAWQEGIRPLQSLLSAVRRGDTTLALYRGKGKRKL